jgi:hypothetical protein
MATQSMESTTATNVSIARGAYDAYVTKDRAALEALLAREFHFTSPLDNRLDRDAYFERCFGHGTTVSIRSRKARMT